MAQLTNHTFWAGNSRILQKKSAKLQEKIDYYTNLLDENEEDLKHQKILEQLSDTGILDRCSIDKLDDYYGYTYSFWYRGFEFAFHSDTITGSDSWDYFVFGGEGSLYGGDSRSISHTIMEFIAGVNLMYKLKGVFPGELEIDTRCLILRHGDLKFEFSAGNSGITISFFDAYCGDLDMLGDWNLDEKLLVEFEGVKFEGHNVPSWSSDKENNQRLATFLVDDLQMLVPHAGYVINQAQYFADPDITIGVVIKCRTTKEAVEATIIHNGSLKRINRTLLDNVDTVVAEYKGFFDKLDAVDIDYEDWHNESIKTIMNPPKEKD